MKLALTSWLGVVLFIVAAVLAVGIDALRPDPGELTGRAGRVGRRWLWLSWVLLAAVMAAALVATAIRLSAAYNF